MHVWQCSPCTRVKPDQAGWLAVVGEWGKGAGDICSCALISLVEEVMTDMVNTH